MRYVIVLIIVLVTMETAILLVEITNALKNQGKKEVALTITLILSTSSLYLCMVPLISCQLLKFWQVMLASTIILERVFVMIFLHY